MSRSVASGNPGVVSETTPASPGLSALTSTPYMATLVPNPPANTLGSGPESRVMSTNTRPVIGSAWSVDGNVTATRSGDPAGPCARQPSTNAATNTATELWIRVMPGNVRPQAQPG